MKKVLAYVLSAMMLVTALVSCTAKPASTPASTPASAPASTPGATGPDLSEHVELTWYVHGSNVTDDKAIMEKVNAILKEKLNVTLKPIWGTWGDFDDGAVNAINGNDNIDIYFTCSWSKNEYNAFSRKGAYLRLDDPNNNLIEKYASDLWSKLPEVLTAGAKIAGKQGTGVYAIPGYKDIATQNCWGINVPLLTKYGYTVDDIKNTDFYGFEEILAKVKAGEGKDFYPLLVEGAVLERMVNNSIIVTGDSSTANVLSYYIDPTDTSKASAYGNTILNKFATPEFEKFAKQVRKYYQAGYIDPAMSNPQQANDKRVEIQNAGKYLIDTQSYSLGFEASASATRGFEVAYVPCTPAYVDTTSSQGAMMAVSTVSKNPDRAVMFLNELNTNPELFRLLTFGIEGQHYKVIDGKMEIIPESGFDAWENGIGSTALEGNSLPLTTQDANFWDGFREYYGKASSIPVLGYSFDATPVATELSAVGNAAAQYMLTICTGSVDPETELPKFLKALEDNGMQKVVDEANKQLTDYLASK